MARFGSTFACDFDREEDEEMKEKLGGFVVHLKLTWREMLLLGSSQNLTTIFFVCIIDSIRSINKYARANGINSGFDAME